MVEVIKTDDKIKLVWKNKKGQIHRNGNKPAIIHADGWKEYYKNGEEYFPIKSFKGACKMLKLNPKVLPKVSFLPKIDQKSIIAHYKFIIIARALNQGWTPDWNNSSQQKWYPWFKTGSGFGFSNTAHYSSDSGTDFGSRLCFKNEKLAKWAGKNFENLYKEYLMIEDKTVTF